jgi:hypothetical protein
LAECLRLLSCALWSRLSSIISLYFPPFKFALILTSLPVPAGEKHSHSLMQTPPCLTVGKVSYRRDTWHSGQRVQSWFQSWFWVFRCPLANSKLAVMCLLLRSGFHLATTIKTWLVESCRDGCPAGRFSHLHRGTLEFCQSDHQFLGHLCDQRPSPPIAQFGQVL